MDIYKEKKQHLKDYFNKAAATRIKYRRSKSYYWDSITRYVDFFIDDESSVLEIGCGTGELLNKIKGKEKTGIDFSEKMIEEAQKQFPEIKFVCCPAESIELDKKFDVVVLSNVIGYLVDIQQVFEEIHKVCHAETKIVITYYNIFWEPLIKFAEFIGIKKRGPKQSWISRKDLANLLYLAGFETYKQNSSMLFPFYVPLLSSFLNKFLSRLPVFNWFALNQYSFAQPVAKVSEEEVQRKYSTTVLIPARNESGNIENAILRMPDFGNHIEIIFVEGNSTDDTWEKVQQIQQKYKDTHDIKILQQPGKGKGDAVRAGYDVATGDILMILDADLTVPPEQLPKFYNAIAANKGGFINGTRLIYPMEKNAMRFLNTLGNKFFSLAFSWLLEQPVKDTLCGTKVMFRKDYLRLAANRSYFGNFDPFGDFDLLFGAFKLNLKIIDMPIRYQERIYGDTNISRFKHGLLLLKMWWFALFKIKFM
ncbi:Methyltransferase domain-containing protein [Mariniphaga anaerophila]|uniref:Methyltransferase domain-containing protein n=1 Tax=Mariniphaga anaerophila TaxID=1484053 RepID=A0A1M5E3H6_9BACT|nr:glycosyltransferase [Mariniphaga anaerophila]SHF73783.1 Methyltransferase domain-containing protein [Mariniphaga anaerophila]